MALKDVFNLAVDHFKSADFQITGKMKVGDIQKSFEENFGLHLRIYNGVRFADDDKTLHSLSTVKKKALEDHLSITASMKVEEVVQRFKEGIVRLAGFERG